MAHAFCLIAGEAEVGSLVRPRSLGLLGPHKVRPHLKQKGIKRIKIHLRANCGVS
jgi:hypothetical protein